MGIKSFFWQDSVSSIIEKTNKPAALAWKVCNLYRALILIGLALSIIVGYYYFVIGVAIALISVIALVLYPVPVSIFALLYKDYFGALVVWSLDVITASAYRYGKGEEIRQLAKKK